MELTEGGWRMSHTFLPWIVPMTTVGKADRSMGVRRLGEVESGKQATIRRKMSSVWISQKYIWVIQVEMSKRLFETGWTWRKTWGSLACGWWLKPWKYRSHPKKPSRLKAKHQGCKPRECAHLLAGTVGPRKKWKKESRKNAKEPKGESFKRGMGVISRSRATGKSCHKSS